MHSNADDLVAINTETVSRDVIHFLTGELHKIRTDFTGALHGFATQEDLGAAVNLVANRAVEAATEAISGVVQGQERWQNEQRVKQERHEKEQRQKLDTFIDDIKARLDTLAPLATVESLRTNFEDSHRHFTSITGAHGEAITTLKQRLDTFEQKTNENVHGIKSDTTAMRESVMQFIEASRERQAATSSRLDTFDSIQQQHTSHIEKVKSEQRSQDMIIRDIEGRVMMGMERNEKALYGNEKEKEPGLIADVNALKQGLSLQSFLFGTKIGRGLLIAGYFASVYLVQHPEILSFIKLPGN